jgi:hypothetical protein
MAGGLKRRPADAALLWAALFAALLPSIFLAAPVAWWVWERDWPGIGWLSRILAVGAALVIPALMLGAAWFAVRWLDNRGDGGTQDAAAETVTSSVTVAVVESVGDAEVTKTAEASGNGTDIVDPLEMEPSAL